MCVFTLRGTVGNLDGMLCDNVDDTICGGSGSLFSKSLTALRHRLSFRNMVVRRVHQHADFGLKIRRMLVQCMMLLLHVDASFNTGGLVGSQGGYICGVTDKSLLEGRDAPWSPMAWRSFKMSRTVPSSLGAEAQAMSVALGLVEWATLFLQELIHGPFDLQGAPAVMQERPPVCVTDCKSL